MAASNRRTNAVGAIIVVFALVISGATAQAEIDGHGPDAWRVTGVAAGDVLNARMGPGTNYPAVEAFAHDERGMQQITCVPFYTAAHYTALTQAQIEALPPRWCLMRDASMHRAGWVAQRFITPDNAGVVPAQATQKVTKTEDEKASSGDAIIDKSRALVRELYDAAARAEQGRGADPLEGNSAARFFTGDIVALLRSGRIGAHPLYGGQDFDGRITGIAPDRDRPILRGMVTVNVDFINFGQKQRAVYFLRADTEQAGSPLRIFRVEHDGWAYP